MHCPNCKNQDLLPTKLETSLSAFGCRECGGKLLNLVAYRLWRELHATEAESETALVAEPEEGRDALLCSKCSRIMLKFRYTTDTEHVIDVCNYCEDIWLQENEWEFLKRFSLHGDIPKIFTEPWQRDLRSQRTRQTLEEEWDRRLGPELHSTVKELAAWLEEQPQKDSVLDYLSSHDPYSVS